MHLEQLSPHTGVEVRGVDLRQPLSPDVRDQLYQQFITRSVLVVRDQSLAPAELLRTVKQFGEVFTQHNARFQLAECPQIHYISNQDHYPDGSRYIPGSGYHTDHSNAPEPPKATILHAVQLPDHGGDTQYVNMHEAYASLPAATRNRIDTLQAVHVYQSRHSERTLMGLASDNAAIGSAEVVHPVVRTHPETQRKALYLNPIRIDRIIGMEERAALNLLDELLTHAVAARHEYRHQWQPGDVVMWDNRSLLHKANPDYDMAQMRYLYRVMLKGDRPY